MKHYCEYCGEELKGDITTFSVCHLIEDLFCDDKCLDKWVYESVKLKRIDDNGRII